MRLILLLMLILLLISLISGCGNLWFSTPKYKIPVEAEYGELLLEGDLEKIDATAELTARYYTEAFDLDFDKAIKTLRRRTPWIILESEHIECGVPVPVAGCFKSRTNKTGLRILVLWDEECRAFTSLSHEFIHYFDLLLRDTIDTKHEDRTVWGAAESVDMRVRWDRAEAECPMVIQSAMQSLESH